MHTQNKKNTKRGENYICPLKIKITQFLDGFRLKAIRRKILLIDAVRS